MQYDQHAAHLAAILNACYVVRTARRPHQREIHARAVESLGRAVRDALNSATDYAPILRAIVEGLTADERAPL